jgi:hypothetical protein
MDLMDKLKDIKDAVLDRWDDWSGTGKNIVNEIVAQSWTIFGLLVGWIVLPDGDTRNFVGTILLWLCVIWLITMPLRISSKD